MVRLVHNATNVLEEAVFHNAQDMGNVPMGLKEMAVAIAT
jgi:hypothetical protein